MSTTADVACKCILWIVEQVYYNLINEEEKATIDFKKVKEALERNKNEIIEKFEDTLVKLEKKYNKKLSKITNKSLSSSNAKLKLKELMNDLSDRLNRSMPQVIENNQ